MEPTYKYSDQLNEFFKKNSQIFEQKLLNEAVTVKDKIAEILRVGNIDLVNNAHKLVAYMVNGEDAALKKFAEVEGIAWATHSLTLSFKLEWIHAIRRTIWGMIEQFYKMNEKWEKDEFFRVEKNLNNRVDDFLNTFFIKYSTYKDALIKEQRELVENLSVPIIPINHTICILPLIGSLDANRAEILREKVLDEVSESRIEILILDLSGIASMEKESIRELMKVIDGILMMGCKTVITGIRKEIVREMTTNGIKFNAEIQTLGTLQQALNEYFITQ